MKIRAKDYYVKWTFRARQDLNVAFALLPGTNFYAYSAKDVFDEFPIEVCLSPVTQIHATCTKPVYDVELDFPSVIPVSVYYPYVHATVASFIA